MKKILGLSFAALIIVAGLAADSFAQTSRNRSWSINNRERRQQRRVYQGVRSGRLTARETLRLERQQYRLRRTEARFRRSGDGLSLRERYRLQRSLNRTSRNIYRQKHDRNRYPNSRRRP